MKKKTNARTLIRQIVREEVAMAIKEVITELNEPTQQVSQPKPKKKIAGKKNYTKNSVLNDVLNETADGNWETLGGGEFTTERMNELVGGQHSNITNSNTPTVNPNDPVSQFIKKDYREVLKKSEEKSKMKNGR